MIFRMYNGKRSVFFICALFLLSFTCSGQPGMYPPLTKWYQDPMGLKPIQLSSAAGFAWGSIAIAASLIFTKNDSSFQKRVSFYQEAGAAFGYKSPFSNSFQNDAGIMYAIRKWMALGLTINILYFNDDINNTWAFGFRPFIRWYPYQRNKIKLFFEYGAGCAYSISRFPLTGTGWKADTARTGTRFNFTTKYSAGAEFQLCKSVLLQLGVRHFHLSNGNIKGIQRNPSYDGNGLFAGLIYAIRP